VQRTDQIPGRHVGRPACVIGTGPSLEGFDFSRLGGAVTFALNGMAKTLPDADYLPILDLSAYSGGKVRAMLEEFAGEVIAPRGFGRFFSHPITEFDLDNGDGPMSFDWPRLAIGRPVSASLACAIAWVMGCRPIYLLGCDYRLGPAGQSHCQPGGRIYLQVDLDGLRAKHERVLCALSAAGADLVNVTSMVVAGVEHGYIQATPYSTLKWQPVADLAGFDLRRSI